MEDLTSLFLLAAYTLLLGHTAIFGLYKASEKLPWIFEILGGEMKKFLQILLRSLMNAYLII